MYDMAYLLVASLSTVYIDTPCNAPRASSTTAKDLLIIKPFRFLHSQEEFGVIPHCSTRNIHAGAWLESYKSRECQSYGV